MHSRLSGIRWWISSGAGRRRPRSASADSFIGWALRMPASREKSPCSSSFVCRTCSTAWGWKSPAQPGGGEGLEKRKGGENGLVSAVEEGTPQGGHLECTQKLRQEIKGPAGQHRSPPFTVAGPLISCLSFWVHSRPLPLCRYSDPSRSCGND